MTHLSLLDRHLPEQLSLPDLAARCSEERAKFQKNEPSDTRYSLELFRRALLHRNDDAWAYLYEQYAPLVLTWIAQVAHGSPEESVSLVNAAFAKFAQALPPARWGHFEQVAGLLKYLKLCAKSVVLDEQRARRARHQDESLDLIEWEPRAHDTAEDVIAGLAAQGIWEIIWNQLHSEDERVLVLAYLQGYKPLEVWQRHRNVFATVEDVYRVKRNIVERLRRNRHLLLPQS